MVSESQKKAMRKYWKKHYPEKRAEILLRKKTMRQQKVKILLALIGHKCVVCESENDIDFHEIHGNPHPHNIEAKTTYMQQHPKDFVSICSKHHYLIHRFAKRLQKEPNPILLIELMRNLY